MIANGVECEVASESLFPCGCLVSMATVNTGAAAGKWVVVVTLCSVECERGKRWAAA